MQLVMVGVVSRPSYIQYRIDSISIFLILVFKILSIVTFSNSWCRPPLATALSAQPSKNNHYISSIDNV